MLLPFFHLDLYTYTTYLYCIGDEGNRYLRFFTDGSLLWYRIRLINMATSFSQLKYCSDSKFTNKLTSTVEQYYCCLANLLCNMSCVELC